MNEVSEEVAHLDEVPDTKPHLIKVRDRVVMIDTSIADLFSVETRALNQAVKRNIERFGEDYAFQLSSSEFENLKSQAVISSRPTWGGRRAPPWVFTRDGVMMAASVLKSPRAVATLKIIVETFSSVMGQLNVQNMGIPKKNPLHPLRETIARHVGRMTQAIADIEVRAEKGTPAVGEQLKTLAGTAFDEAKALLSRNQMATKGIDADIHLKLAEAERTWAERERALAEARKLNAQAVREEIAAIKDTMSTMQDLMSRIDAQDPAPVMGFVQQFDGTALPLLTINANVDQE